MLKEDSICEFCAFTFAVSSCPNKSPEMVFKLGVIFNRIQISDRLIVEFNLPSIAPAIGAMDFSISSCVNYLAISTLSKPKFILNVGTFPLVDTTPSRPILPSKILVLMFCSVTA